MTNEKTLNLLGTELQPCSTDPLTGFLRDGCCQASQQDRGAHIVCAVLTDEFLQYSLSRGNDLISARPEFNFPGLTAGDSWCLCASRWIEAYQAGVAPPIKPESTHQKLLARVDINIVKPYFIQ